MLLRLVSCLLALSLGISGSSGAQARNEHQLEDAGVTARVDDLGDGRFAVEYLFEDAQDLMIFARSDTDYRRDAWQIVSPGVRLERIGQMDTLIFDTPVTTAQFEVTARPELDYAGYTDFTEFSDGSLVIFTGQFELLVPVSLEEVERLDGDLGRFEGEQPVLAVRLRSQRNLIQHGRAVVGEAVDVSLGGGSFIYIGDGNIDATENYVGLIDPATPDWIQARFPGDMAYLFEALEAGWGFALPEPATLMFAFEGYDNPGFSNKGGVLGRQLMIRSGGSELREEDDFIHAYLLWFFAHESVHLFQYVSPSRIADPHDSWIHEGSANAMANRIMAEQGAAAEPYLRYSFSNAFDQCVAALEAGVLREAGQRGQFNAHYACGEFIALIADAAAAEGDLFDIWNRMQAMAIDAATEENPDGAYDLETFVRAAQALGMDDATADWVRHIVTEPVSDPATQLTNALAEHGLNPQFNEDGKLTGITYPQ